MAFEGLTDKQQNAFKKLSGKGKLSEADVKAAMREVRMALLEADVNFTVVKDFIKNEGRNCKLAGTWKVYHDEQNARKTFCKFKKCTDIYCQMLGKGTPLRRLTVAG